MKQPRQIAGKAFRKKWPTYSLKKSHGLTNTPKASPCHKMKDSSFLLSILYREGKQLGFFLLTLSAGGRLNTAFSKEQSAPAQ